MTIYNDYPNAVANAIEKALVAALAEVIKVPVSFGIVIVLSAIILSVYPNAIHLAMCTDLLT